MKHSFISACLGLLLGLPLVIAQNVQPAPPADTPIAPSVPPPGANPALPANFPPRVGNPPSMPFRQTPAENPIPANLPVQNRSILLEGNLGENRAIKLTLTSAGPEFQSNSLTDDGSLISVRYTTTYVEQGPLVDFSIGAQVPVSTGTSISYRDLRFTGRVLCLPGKTVEIYRNEKQVLALTFSPEKK